jgi:hypothetical protein
MIFGYVGVFGGGKTLNMVYDIMYKMIYHDRHIYSNIPIKFTDDEGVHYEAQCVPDGKEFRKGIFKQRNTDIVIDEAELWLPNFMWNKLPPQVMEQFHEQRKTGCNIYYTAQVAKHSVKRLRDLSFVVYRCNCRRILPIRFEWITSYRRADGLKRFRKHFFDPDWNKIYITKRFLPEYFEGSTQSEKKYQRYFLGTRILWPSDSRRVFKAYKTDYMVKGGLIQIKDYDPDEKPKDEEKIEILTAKR